METGLGKDMWVMFSFKMHPLLNGDYLKFNLLHLCETDEYLMQGEVVECVCVCVYVILICLCVCVCVL